MKKAFSVFLLIFLCTKHYSQDTIRKKDGFEIKYYDNGKPKSKIYFKDGKPFGIAQMFNEQGGLSEVGYWSGDRWIGNYYLYYPNGQKIHAFNFGANGKRTGIQTFYFSNGIIKDVSLFIDGKPEGAYYNYDSLGSFISKKIEVFDTVLNKTITINTTESFPADSTILDYVKNENLNVFRISSLRQAEIDAKLKNEKINSEKKQKLVYLVAFVVCGLLLLFVIYSWIELNRKKLKNEIQSKIIEEQKKSVEEKHKEITDSIHYAKRIQTALITSEKYIDKNLNRLRKD